MTRSRRSVVASGATLASLFFVATCAMNPTTGRREPALVSEAEEIEMGRRASLDVVASLGRYPDPQMQSFVSGIGLGMAKRTKRPDLPWEFIVLDDASVNAFALPGGKVFITRGMLAALTSEAELAGVIGHESGHVAARHSVHQMGQQRLASVGIGLMSELVPAIANHIELAASGVGLLLLKNGRADETQADKLGFWYAVAEGYDTRTMLGLFGRLPRDGEAEGRGRLPEWQATHPDPEFRIRDVERLIQTSTHDFEALRVDREGFLRRLDGMPFGPDPRAGFFRDGMFVHPELRFTLRMPDGWRAEHAAQSVTALSDDNDAIVQLRGAEGTASQSAQRFFAQEGLRSGQRSIGTRDGNPFVSGEFIVPTDDGEIHGIASFVEYGTATWAMVAYAPASRYAHYAPEFKRSIESFSRLTDPADLAAQPLRIAITAAPRAMTLREFDRILPSGIPLEELAIINGLTATTRLTAGQSIKRVVGRRVPQVSGREAARR